MTQTMRENLVRAAYGAAKITSLEAHAIVDAVLDALRTPTETMVETGDEAPPYDPLNGHEYGLTRDDIALTFTAMIDAVRSEKRTKIV
jgi:hypothetical protein